MALPKVIHPTKKIKVPSLDLELEFEPFTTADEKAIVLLEDNATLYDKCILQQNILQKCCKSDFDFSKLSTIEITYLFLQLRKISVGGTLDLVGKCPNCGSDVAISVDISLIEFDPTNLKPLKFTIDTSDGPYIVVCTQFTCEDMKYIDPESPSVDNIATVIRSMMKPDGNDVIELTQEEKVELFNQLNTKDAEKIAEYINSSPVLEKSLDLSCGECEHQFKGELKDFFI